MNFYPVPPTIQAELFVRIPDEIRCIDKDSEWRGGFARAFQHIFLEGPVVDDLDPEAIPAPNIPTLYGALRAACATRETQLIEHIQHNVIADGHLLGASWYNTYSVFSAELVLFAALVSPALRREMSLA